MSVQQCAKAYRWPHPLAWLNDHLDEIANDEHRPPEIRVSRLLFECKQLAAKLDADDIQDEYQNLMDEDGYFTRRSAAQTGR